MPAKVTQKLPDHLISLAASKCLVCVWAWRILEVWLRADPTMAWNHGNPPKENLVSWESIQMNIKHHHHYTPKK